jgi:hypothetical protein
MRHSAKDEPPMGERPEISPETLLDRLERTDETVGELTFMRRGTVLETVDGEKITAGLDEIKPSLAERAGHYWAELDSHKKRRVLVTGGGLLAAAGGYFLVKNRTQRKKMKR